MAKRNTITRSASAQTTKSPLRKTIKTNSSSSLTPTSELPPQLAAIYQLLKTPPENISIASPDIDEIVEGKFLRDHLETIDKGLYLDNMLGLIDWLVKLAHPLFDLEAADPGKACGECEECVLESKLGDLFSFYRIAYVARYNVDAYRSDPTGLELLKRLRDFRNYICGLILQDFPEADLSSLLKVA